MSDNEGESFVFEPLTKNKRKEKKKASMTPERRAQLLLNLAKGRETSRLNRQKKGKAKKIIKAQKKDEIDEIIENDLKKKTRVADLEEKLRLMEEKLNEKNKSKPKVKENIKLAVESEEEDVFDEEKKEIKTISKDIPRTLKIIDRDEEAPKPEKKNLTPLQLWKMKKKKK